MTGKREKEKTILEEIAWKLKANGWLVVRLPPSIYSHKGIPDLLAIRKRDYLLIEVKSLKGKLTKSQQLFKLLVESISGNYIVAKSWEDVKNYMKEKNLNT